MDNILLKFDVKLEVENKMSYWYHDIHKLAKWGKNNDEIVTFTVPWSQLFWLYCAGLIFYHSHTSDTVSSLKKIMYKLICSIVFTFKILIFPPPLRYFW